MAILVAYDGSEPAQKAVRRAFDEYPDEEIVLLRVIEVADSFTKLSMQAVQEMIGNRREEVTEELHADVGDLSTNGVDFRTEVTSGDPAREIVAYAEEHDIDHILVGSHGREGVSRVLLGNVAEGVVRRAPVSVTVIR
ncbi:universal stress protein [Natronolimnobius baerhuensis]|uniref:Universal stress protein UspA n=1 Tax=Natronolimnobius baerhuensis TaxID=253108 RepID=A0A202E5M9_9EURY|nr:universal stress protein [Natronolimnobius baerhuensis]OVE83561.1 universal stress protein UspA [Natronolimnobius baerhuensis]